MGFAPGDFALYGSALALGLLGGGHCLAMCGAWATLASPACQRRWGAGRLLSYTLAGAVAGTGAQWLAFGAARSGFLHSVWVLMQLAAGLLALALLIVPQRIGWAALGGAQGWRVVQWSPGHRPFLWGLGWAGFPCGLLHAALALALLAGDGFRGAAVMLAFSLGTGVWLGVGGKALQALRASGRLTESRLRQVAGASLLLAWVVVQWSMAAGPSGSLWCTPPN